MTEKKEQTPEEKAQDERRDIALKNLKADNLINLATLYTAENENFGYGENDRSAVDEFLYQPSLNAGPKFYDFETGEEYNPLTQGLVGTRQGGRRLSGNISEYQIAQSAARIFQESIASVKVSDVMGLLDSKSEIDEKYKDMYISDLLKSEDKEVKELGQTLFGGYQNYITSKKISFAIGERAKGIKSGLEDLVKAPEKKAA